MRLDSLQGRPGLLVADISGGAEPNTPIPLFDELLGGEGDGGGHQPGLDPGFKYVADYVYAPGVQQQVTEGSGGWGCTSRCGG